MPELRSALLLALVILVVWLAARVLRRSLLGRFGQVSKLVLALALFGLFGVTLFLSGFGLSPWGPVHSLLPRSPGIWAIVIGAMVVVWLLLREFRFRVPAQLGFILESPVRRLLAPADIVLSRMALGPGMRVVEIGCGTGHLSVEVAPRIEPGGMLFCVDIQPEMVEKTIARTERRLLRNVTGFVAPAQKLPFDVFDIDLVFMAHVLGEIDDRLAALREALRVLRPGAVLSVSEALIDPHYRFRNDVVRLCRQVGFEPVSIQGSLFNYTATFRKPQPAQPLGYVPRF